MLNQKVREQVKAQGYDLRTSEGKKAAAEIEKVFNIRKIASVTVKKTINKLAEDICLCGCRHQVPTGRNFKQGHDAKLKSKILRGIDVPSYGMDYAKINWPHLL